VRFAVHAGHGASERADRGVTAITRNTKPKSAFSQQRRRFLSPLSPSHKNQSTAMQAAACPAPKAGCGRRDGMRHLHSAKHHPSSICLAKERPCGVLFQKTSAVHRCGFWGRTSGFAIQLIHLIAISAFFSILFWWNQASVSKYVLTASMSPSSEGSEILQKKTSHRESTHSYDPFPNELKVLAQRWEEKHNSTESSISVAQAQKAIAKIISSEEYINMHPNQGIIFCQVTQDRQLDHDGSLACPHHGS